MDHRTALPASLLSLSLLLIPVALTTAPAHAQGSGRPGAATCLAPTAAEVAAAVAATNAARAARGMAAVRGNAALSAAAADHACDMARRGSMTHRGSRSSGPSQRARAAGYRPAITAENIAAGPFDVAGALAAWSGSAGHLANMLIPQIRDVGIGQAIAADGRTRFWAAIFAAPR